LGQAADERARDAASALADPVLRSSQLVAWNAPMKVRIVVGLVVGSVLLTACAALPVPFGSEVKPAATVVDDDAVTPRDGAGAVIVTRDWQFRDMGCIYDVVLDDNMVAELRPGEQVTVYPEPGKRMLGISIRPKEKDCEPAVAQVPLDVVASATTKVRVRADGYYQLRVEATTF